ncbi:MAG: hypothetical protein HC880_18810 [Bacteroidia bacterium]|nr:hypothetical protein [Bacteroidia bacterium]
MNYEIQIFAKDRTKIIRFKDTVLDSQLGDYQQLLAWEDYYYAMGAVIDDKAEKIRENERLIARLDVKDISFDEVVEVMCEDLSPALTKILVEENEVSVVQA